MGVHSAISLADFGQELIRRTLVTFVRAAKLTFGAMLASAAVFSLISLFQRYPMATAKVMGLIFLSATVALLTRVHFGRLTGTVQGEQTLREAVNERYASDLNWESTPLKQREEINIRSLERLDPGYVKDAAVKGLWRHAESETLRNRYLLAQVLGKRGRNNEALEVLRGLLWRYKELGLSSPETISSRYLLAQILSKLGRTDESLAVLRGLILDYQNKPGITLANPETVKAVPLLEQEVLIIIERSILRYEEALSKDI